jgi:ketosteroid isomerase-like protein
MAIISGRAAVSDRGYDKSWRMGRSLCLAAKGVAIYAPTANTPQSGKQFVMKLLTPFLAIMLIALAPVPCTRAEDNSAIETTIKQMENAWEKAWQTKDTGALGNILADDYAGMNSKGERQNKSQLLNELKTMTDTVSASVTDSMDVHVYGPNLAMVVGTSTEKGMDKDRKAFTRSFGWVDTWMQRNGKWECIGEGVMALPEKK